MKLAPDTRLDLFCPWTYNYKDEALSKKKISTPWANVIKLFFFVAYEGAE